MSSPDFDLEADTYRRRVRVRATAPGVVVSEMEDDFHFFAVTLRHAMSERVEDSGHLVPVEQPEEFRARLERWREQVGL